MDTYLSHIVQNIHDAIIVYDRHASVKIFNHAAEMLFQIKGEEVLNRSLSGICEHFPIEVFNGSDVVLREIECRIKKQLKKLLISKTVFKDQDGGDHSILVVRDLTEMKRLEEQMYQKEHMSAIGQLASGVAHEIRNPLNTISTIIQQLLKDFEPKENSMEYYQLATLIQNEAQRINKTVQGFLSFAFSNPMRPQLFRLSRFMNLIAKEYQLLLREHKLHLAVDQAWDGEVYWDKEKMRQALMDLIQNAIDALGPNGRISIAVTEVDENALEIKIHDNGPGIPEEIRTKIFQLYFTTKARAKGIGLSKVRQIIYEHGGSIFLDHPKKSGTTFVIQMPKKVKISKRGSCR